MNGVTVQVDLAQLVVGTRFGGDPDDPSVEPIDLLTVVLDSIARQLLEQFKNQARNGEIYPRVHDRVREIRDEEIRAALQPAVADALAAAVQPTNHFGESKGEPVTIREIVVQTAAKWLQTPASDSYGKPSETPIQKFIKREVEESIANELRPIVEQAKADVLAAVRTEGAKVLTETIARMGGVR